jgi:bacterioferritin (cytochrome b1)
MDPLFPLLRAELTAVNQQFIHVLALQRLGDSRRADRIYEVDRVDFPNAMRIIDRLAARGEPIALPPELPAPGLPLTGLLTAELRLEDRLQEILAVPHAADDEAGRLLDAATSPRAAYRAWLTAELSACEDVDVGISYPAVDPLFSCLIVLLERLMVRAFMTWHAGAREDADIAWASSGVAMVQATDLVNALTDLHAVPKPANRILTEIPAALEIGDERDLIAAFARIADEAAARESEPSLKAICTRISRQAAILDAWRPGIPHPALSTCAPPFKSFEATLRKFVWPNEARI